MTIDQILNILVICIFGGILAVILFYVLARVVTKGYFRTKLEFLKDITKKEDKTDGV